MTLADVYYKNTFVTVDKVCFDDILKLLMSYVLITEHKLLLFIIYYLNMTQDS